MGRKRLDRRRFSTVSQSKFLHRILSAPIGRQGTHPEEPTPRRRTSLSPSMTILKLLLLANLALINACTDSYAQPNSGGDWCSDISGVSDGQNCWGGCATGCPTCSSPGCSIETRGPTTASSCRRGASPRGRPRRPPRRTRRRSNRRESAPGDRRDGPVGGRVGVNAPLWCI